MKKMLACFCCVSLLLGIAVCSVPAKAAEKPNGISGEKVIYAGITYEVFDEYASVEQVDNELYTAYNPDFAQSRVFAFPTEIKNESTGKTIPVSTIDGEYKDLAAKKVIIQKIVKRSYAHFTGNQVLEEVTFEEGSLIEELPVEAFDSCVNLKRIGVESTNKLPDSINTINSRAFLNCSNLESIVLPDNLNRITGQVFEGCVSLKEIEIPATVTTVGNDCFSGCTNLTKVNFKTFTTGENKGKSNLEYFDQRVFKDCISLREVNLPVSTNKYKIDFNCFENAGLKSIIIPESVSQILPDAFLGVNFENTFETDKGEKFAIGLFSSQCELSFWNGKLFGDAYNGVPKDERPTIAGLAYSTANDFAIKEGYNFVAVGDWNPFKVICPGDVDGDGKSSAKDSMIIQRYTVNLVNLTADQAEAADINKDGKVTSKDALLVLRYTVGFPVEGLS